MTFPDAPPRLPPSDDRTAKAQRTAINARALLLLSVALILVILPTLTLGYCRGSSGGGAAAPCLGPRFPGDSYIPPPEDITIIRLACIAALAALAAISGLAYFRNRGSLPRPVRQVAPDPPDTVSMTVVQVIHSCPRCGATLQFVGSYQRWWCAGCGQWL